jgi:hypothetical protein
MTNAECVKKIRTSATHTKLTQAAASEIADLVFNTVTAAIKSDKPSAAL